MIKVGNKSMNESVSINSIKKLFGATKDSEIITLDKSSKFYKSELKKLGCKRVIVTSPGYGFSDEIHAYENNNPKDSSFIVSVTPLKNDGEYNFEVNYLHGSVSESVKMNESIKLSGNFKKDVADIIEAIDSLQVPTEEGTYKYVLADLNKIKKAVDSWIKDIS